METKKSKDANLENKKFVFFALGLVMVSSLVLMGFKYESADICAGKNLTNNDGLEEEFVYELPEIIEEIIEKEPKASLPPIIIDIVVVEDEDDIQEYDLSSIGEDIEEIEDPEIDDCNDCDEEIYEVPAVDPHFPGGEGSMGKFIRDNIQFTSFDVEVSDGGMVYVQFVVNIDGSIEQINVPQGLSDGINESAMNVVRQMPKWIPGEQAGKKVRCRMTLPINVNFGK